MMEELWQTIIGFASYAVSNYGRVQNVDTGRMKVPSQNQSGIWHVLLVRNTQQFRRSVSGLVARAFLDPPQRSDFNTVIHLDGDRSNCYADNLMWRPRWYAQKYHQQFEPGAPRGFRQPVRELHTGEVFPTSWEAAIKYGLIDSEIRVSTLNRTYVFPTGQIFHTLDV